MTGSADWGELEEMFNKARQESDAYLALMPPEKRAFVRTIITEATCSVVREYILPLLKKTKALEAVKFIDSEVIDELANCLERVEVLEKAIEGRGMKFMGKWNRDVDFQASDVVVHASALWVSKRPTREVPGTGQDWQRMLKADARHGRAGDASAFHEGD